MNCKISLIRLLSDVALLTDEELENLNCNNKVKENQLRPQQTFKLTSFSPFLGFNSNLYLDLLAN